MILIALLFQVAVMVQMIIVCYETQRIRTVYVETYLLYDAHSNNITILQLKISSIESNDSVQHLKPIVRRVQRTLYPLIRSYIASPKIRKGWTFCLKAYIHNVNNDYSPL